MAKKTNRVAEAIIEMADDMHRTDVMDDATYYKIIERHPGPQTSSTAAPIKGEEPIYSKDVTC
jgi:hypothetical protein